MANYRFKITFSEFVVTLALISITPLSLAQQKTETIEEILVTATKRELTVLDTPATITALSSDEIDTYKVVDFRDLNYIVPGYQYLMGAGSNMSLSFRGIGTTSSAQSFEQSVAPYEDGIYLGGNNREFSWPLFDLERIEVLKGTQSGIVGQNTTAGTMNFITRKPGHEFGGYLRGSYEFENNGWGAEGAVDVPFSDSLRARFTGYYQKRGGWQHNVITGHDRGERDMYAGRVNVEWDASEKVRVRFMAEYDDMELIGSLMGYIFNDISGAYTAYVAPYLTFKPGVMDVAYFQTDPVPGLGVWYGGDDGAKADALKSALTLDIDLGNDLKLISITAVSSVDDDLSVDQDNTQADIPATASNPAASQALSQSAHYDSYTQELRLSSATDQRFSYIVGAWYRHAEQKKTTAISFGTAYPAAAILGITWPYKQTTDNASLFGDIDYKLTDKISIGGNVRYTDETKDGRVEGIPTTARGITYGAHPAFRPFSPVTSNLKEKFWDGSARVQYQPNDDTTLYAYYGHGTKTGALHDLVASGTPTIVKPEKMETYEIGLKGQLLDSTLNYSVALFYQDIKDYQDSAIGLENGVLVFRSTNTDVSGKGVDADLHWQATENFFIGVIMEYLDNEDDFRGGSRFIRSPEWSAGANFRYTFPFMQYQGELYANVLTTSKFYNNYSDSPDRELTKTPGETTLDIGANVSLSDSLNVRLLCKNCTDELIIPRATVGNHGFPQGRGVYAYTIERRTLTLEVSYNF